MMLQDFTVFKRTLNEINEQKALITTLNAHCYNISRIDLKYQQALLNSNLIIPDGIGVVYALRLLTGEKIKKIAGADLFLYELNWLQQKGGKCFFLGSTNNTLNLIRKKINLEYPNIKVETYSPPYKAEFTLEDNVAMVKAINDFQPDVLMIGMTAPKQEKWAYQHFNQLMVRYICCVGAVFDFYSGTINRAPKWMIDYGVEWLYRLIKEPRRMWRRYLIGNIKFIYAVLIEKLLGKIAHV